MNGISTINTYNLPTSHTTVQTDRVYGGSLVYSSLFHIVIIEKDVAYIFQFMIG